MTISNGIAGLSTEERVVDPSPLGEPDRTPVPTGPRRSFGAGVVFFGLAMLVIGIGLGWLVFSAPPGADGPLPPIDEIEASVAGEPVAEVAEALLPSVVQVETAGGIGSGVIYDPDGLILTADHVVSGAEEVRIRLSDGRLFEGEVLGGDESSDVAVVRIEAADLPAAPLGLDPDVRVGQMAVAIGSPYGLNSTVTSGVVSAVNQSVGAASLAQALIQTDAAINPGNSGGALANRQGEVIGINVSIFSRSGGNDGVGFAVPIGIARDLADAIVSGEPINSAVLGVIGTNSDTDSTGALITEVAPGSGAESAGVRVGDVVETVDGVRVQGIGDLGAQIRTNRPGETVTLGIVRDGESIEIEAELGMATALSP
ncbi:hypothetical protein BH23ACT5_BH23ACT5_02970 [soil metagenome]